MRSATSGEKNLCAVRYRVLQPDVFTPPEDHEQDGENTYLAPDESRLESLDEQGVINVIDWEYEPDTEITLSGPPEPVVTEDEDGEERIELLVPVDGPQKLRPVKLGTWECLRCGSFQDLSELVGKEVTEPHVCDGCERKGPFKHQGGLTEDEVQVAHRGPQMWKPPSGVSDENYAGLWDDIYAYLHEHWDAGNGEDADAVYAGLTAYALSTWVRDNLTFVPHLMLMGKTMGGKTRLLNTLKRVSYRAVVTASATPASMFRLIDAYDVSYYISEYHGLSQDSRRELDNVVRAGQKAGETVTRAEQSSTGFEPTVYDPFSHVAIATQYEPADDIVNRCIQVRSSPAHREMPATHDEDTALEIRNRLLYARFRLLESAEWDSAEADAYSYLSERNIVGRTREKLLSLLTVAFIWDRVDDLEPFMEDVVEQDHADVAETEDALVIRAIRDLAFEEIGNTATLGDVDPFAHVEILVGDVATRYEEMTGIEKTASWVGHVRKRLNLDKDQCRDGVVISDADLGPKLQRLCEENNLAWEPSEAHADVEGLPDDEQYRAKCSECGELRNITHRHREGHYICATCASEWEDSA